MPLATPPRPPRPVRPPRATPSLVFGAFILTIGVLMTLDRLDLLDLGRALRFWPLAFIGLGLTMLAGRRDSQGRFWGFTWLFVGSWLLLNSLGIVRVGFWELLWPMLLILFGTSLVMQAMRRGKRSAADSSDSSDLFAMMAETKRTLVDNPFRGANMTAIMGGCVLDLRQAVIPPGDEAVVDVMAVMAGHEVIVPSGWDVVSQLIPIAGGVDDKRLPPVPPPADAAAPSGPPPRLILQGHLIMAGLTIKT